MLLKDGAYAAWQRMVKSGTIPDDVTQRILAACFGSNLRMASEVVKEARQLQAGDCNSGLHSMHTDIRAHLFPQEALPKCLMAPPCLKCYSAYLQHCILVCQLHSALESRVLSQTCLIALTAA